MRRNKRGRVAADASPRATRKCQTVGYYAATEPAGGPGLSIEINTLSSRGRTAKSRVKPVWFTKKHHYAALVMLLTWFALPPVVAGQSLIIGGVGGGRGAAPPQQVQLVVEPGRLIASNARLSRMDVVELARDEVLVGSAAAQAVLIAVTDRRVLGYRLAGGWQTLQVLPDETVVSIDATDYAAFVQTTRRLINFNAQTGLFAELERSEP